PRLAWRSRMSRGAPRFVMRWLAGGWRPRGQESRLAQRGRQVRRANDAPFAERHGVLDRVLQLAHIARIVVALEQNHGGGPEAQSPPAASFGDPGEEIRSQE